MSASFDLPAATLLIKLAVHVTAGILLGTLYFRGLWWNARLFAAAGRTLATVALMIGRFLLLAVVLTLTSLEGAAPLLAMAFGILVARFAVMRTLRQAAS